MTSIWTGGYWKAVAERALWTFAQAGVGFLTVEGVVLGFEDVDWLRTASVAGVAAVLSIGKSLAVNAVTETGPSVVSDEQVVPKDSIVVHEDSIVLPPLGEGDQR